MFFFYVSKVATLTQTQIKAIHSLPYFHMCISVSQPVRNIGIAVFAGIVAFDHLRLLNVITSYRVGPLKMQHLSVLKDIGNRRKRHMLDSSANKHAFTSLVE